MTTIIIGRYAMVKRADGEFNLHDRQEQDKKVFDNGTEKECREWVERNGEQ